MMIYDLGFKFLIDHCPDEIVEAEIVLLTAFFIQRRLDIRGTFELGLKATAILLEEFALFVRGSVRKFVGVDKEFSALSCLSKVL